MNNEDTTAVSDPRREAVARVLAEELQRAFDLDIWARMILAAADAAAPAPVVTDEMVERGIKGYSDARAPYWVGDVMHIGDVRRGVRGALEAVFAADAIERLARERDTFKSFHAKVAEMASIATARAEKAERERDEWKARAAETSKAALLNGVRAEKAEAALEECRQHGVVLAIKSETNDHRAKQAEARADRAEGALKEARDALDAATDHAGGSREAVAPLLATIDALCHLLRE